MGKRQVADGGASQRCLLFAGPALLVALFGWLMLVDGWTTGWPPTVEEVEDEGKTWRQSVRRLPRDMLLVGLLVLLYLHSRAGRPNWPKWRRWDKCANRHRVLISAPHLATTHNPTSSQFADSSHVDLFKALRRLMADVLAALAAILTTNPSRPSAAGWMSWLECVLRAPAVLVLKLEGVLMTFVSVETKLTGQQKHSAGIEDLTESELRSISCLSSGIDGVSALQSLNPNHTRTLKNAIPDSFLLHLGALLGEKSAINALQMLERGHEVGSSAALFGKMEDGDSWDEGWSRPVVKSQPGITFEMTKRRWRRGLFLYKTTTVLEDTFPSDFRAFNMNMENRSSWDWSMKGFCRVKDPAEDDPCGESCFYYHESRMPGPLANRVYSCARRVWNLPDGCCYWITKSATHQSSTLPKGVLVEDYTSGSVLRVVKSRQNRSTPATEFSSIYYDDPKMRAIAYNLAMKSAFWVAMQATEKAFRKWNQTSDTRSLPRNVAVTKSLEVVGSGEECRIGRTQKRRRLPGMVKGLVVGGLVLVAHKRISN